MDFKKILSYIYGFFASLALFGGAVVFLILLIGMIVSGDQGGEIMLYVNHIVPYLMKFATLAILAGIIMLYITKTHSLSLKD